MRVIHGSLKHAPAGPAVNQKDHTMTSRRVFHFRRFSRRNTVLLLPLVLIALTSCKPETPVTPASLPLIVGMEYALPGTA